MTIRASGVTFSSVALVIMHLTKVGRFGKLMGCENSCGLSGYFIQPYGIAGIPDDVQGWSIWLSMLEPYINNYLVRVMLVLCGLAAITYPQWLPTFKKWRRNRNEEASTAPFDMPIRDAVNHLIMTVPYSSEIPSQPNQKTNGHGDPSPFHM